MRKGADVMLFGVQPESIEFREGLSSKLQEASREIADLITEVVKVISSRRASHRLEEKRFSY